METRSASREGEREDASPAAPQRAPEAAAPLGNRTLARAAAALQERPPGRGLTADGARSLARATAHRELMRLTHDVKTAAGDFKITTYETHEDKAGDDAKFVGLKINATYESQASLRSNQIGFVQVMKVTKNGVPYLFENEKPRATDAASGDAGWTVDRVAGKKYGFYGMKDDKTASDTNYWAGSRTSDTAATHAKMYDRVNLPRAKGEVMECIATTFAVDIQHDTYLGAFTWGFDVDAAGKITAKTPGVGSMGASQRTAIENWNKQAALADAAKRNAPDQATLPVPPAPPAPKPPAPAAAKAPARKKLAWYEYLLPWNWF